MAKIEGEAAERGARGGRSGGDSPEGDDSLETIGREVPEHGTVARIGGGDSLEHGTVETIGGKASEKGDQAAERTGGGGDEVPECESTEERIEAEAEDQAEGQANEGSGDHVLEGVSSPEFGTVEESSETDSAEGLVATEEDSLGETGLEGDSPEGAPVDKGPESNLIERAVGGGVPDWCDWVEIDVPEDGGEAAGDVDAEAAAGEIVHSATVRRSAPRPPW